MADNKAQLDPGFDEVPLDEGFEEVPLTPQSSPGVGSTLYNKAADLGNSAINTLKSAGKAGLEDLSDTGRGLVQGATLGGSDEAIAAAHATLGAKIGSPQWIDLYKKYQTLEQSKNKAAQERSPYLYGAGQIGGMLAPAVLTAGAAAPEELGALAAGKLGAGQLGSLALKGAATGAGMGAVSSALGSEQGKLIGATPEEQSALAADTVGGAVTGAVLGGILSPATKVVPKVFNAAKSTLGTKVSNYIADSPFWRQVSKAKDLGEEGTNLYSEKAIQGPIGSQTGLIHQDTNSARDLVSRIYNVDDKLGQAVGESIDNATQDGITLDLTDPMKQSVNTFKSLLNDDQTLMADPKAQKLYDTIFQMDNNGGGFDAGNLTPKEVQSLRKAVVDFSDSIKQKNPTIANLGYQFQGQIGDLLKEAVPEYKTASERFEQFRRLVPETIISGSTPVDISGVNLGSLKNDEAKLFAATKSMIQGSQMPGTAASASKETVKNFLNGLNEFDNAELQRAKSGAVAINDLPKLINTNDQSQADAMKKLVQDKADSSALLQQAWRVNPQENIGTSIKGATFGRGAMVNMANKYGLYKDTLTKPVTAPTTLVKNLYNASEDQLKDIGHQMSQIPGISSVGKALVKGLENKDTMGVNAAIFSIMQNPQARLLINAQDLKNNKENGEQ